MSLEMIQDRGMSQALLSQRFEAKYRLTERRAEDIVRYAAPFVAADAQADARNRYWINSVYLDSMSMRLFRSSCTGEKNRIKLRVRTYSQEIGGDGHLEIKRRTDQIVSKGRAPLDGAYLEGLLRDYGVPRRAYKCLASKEAAALDRFRYLAARYAARPVTWVRYEREAYVDALGSDARLTVDRELSFRCCSPTYDDPLQVIGPWERTTDSRPILELKFTGTAPAWMQDLIRRFELTRVSVSKYVIGVIRLQKAGYPLPRFQKEEED